MNDLKGIIEDCNKSDLVSDRVIKKVIEIIGQEEWQILHDENNDVCTTMGELIITLKDVAELEKENAELKSIAEFQQSSNMSRYFENNKLKEGLAVGSTFNKALNSMNKNLEEKRDKYRNMVFDKDEQLTKAKEIIKMLHSDCYSIAECEDTNLGLWEDDLAKAEQFLKDLEE